MEDLSDDEVALAEKTIDANADTVRKALEEEKAERRAAKAAAAKVGEKGDS